jgi:hypothetical protein
MVQAMLDWGLILLLAAIVGLVIVIVGADDGWQ